MQRREAMINPYDWINPVYSRDHFAGRSEEISMIMEELMKLEKENLISPIVAIIGARRVGKTSLLHRIDENCKSQSLISIIINVDDRMANDIWEFWKQIYDYLFTIIQDVGIKVVSDLKTTIGFQKEENRETNTSNALIGDNLQFFSAYEAHLSSLHSPTLPYQIIKNDLNEFKEIFRKVGYKGIVFIFDEAHNLKESKDVKQYLRNIIQQSPGLGIIFAGEITLGRLFTDTFEPFFGQANVIKLDNFINFDDIMKCALLPLSEEEIKLMNPMTINYLAKLSRGKPNQIRLICCSIYKRYMHGLQDDLNITVDVLDDVLANITNAYSDSEFRDRDLVKVIKKLDSVNLKLLYNITRYPNWQIDEIINLDESFRGEFKSNSAIERRRRMLEAKKAYFTEIGIMEENEDLFQISGGEFLSLYLRFYYETQKYGELSRKLILGKGPPTLFGETTEKLVRSLAYNFGQDLELQRLIFHQYHRDFGHIIETVQRRFEILKELRKGIKPQCDDINELISECISVCELIDKESDSFLLCLSVRNRYNPRELIQVELYLDIHDKYLVEYSNDLRSVFNLLDKQAEEARVLIEGFSGFWVTLPDLSGFLASAGVTFDKFIEELPLENKWWLSSIQHAIHQKNEEKKDLENAFDLHYSEIGLTLMNLSYLNICSEKYEKAIEQIETALLLNLSPSEINVSYLRLHLPEYKSGFFYNKWEQHPANVIEASYINLEFAFLKTYKYEEAHKTLKEGSELFPSSFRIKHALARFYIEKNSN